MAKDRKRHVQQEIRFANAAGNLRGVASMLATFGREDCRIVHLSIQDNHVHLLVEAENRMALARGMQAFEISAAKHMNAAVSNAGSWWSGGRCA